MAGLAVTLLMAAPAVGHAADFAVTNTGDGGAGSLRQAISSANGSPPSRVVFNIPATDPGFAGGVFTIRPGSALPQLTDGITVDGSTQTAFGGDTNPLGPEVEVNGSRAGANTAGIQVSGDSNVINGLVVNGFSTAVVIVYYRDLTPSDNRVANNYIGTDPTGSSVVPNDGGIAVQGFGSPGLEARDNVIEGNLVSGNSGVGMSFCDALRTRIIDNRIGTARSGAALGNGFNGIHMVCAGNPGFQIERNTIAHNGGDGVFAQPDYRFSSSLYNGNAIRRNAIHSNAGIGINLLPPPFGTIDAVTPNDPCDPDIGPNGLQNFPDLSAADGTGSGTNVTGTLDSNPNESFEVEFFANDVADPSGFGEGQTYLGKTSVTTGGSCTGSVVATLAADVPDGKLITATAVDSEGNTSEFSNAIKVETTNGPPDCSALATNPAVLWPANGRLVRVQLSGATDPDGDPVTLAVTGVTQDEPVTGPGDSTSPDAAQTPHPDVLSLRAERSGHGDGRVYRVAVTATDPSGGRCEEVVKVGVPRQRHGVAVDTGETYDSLAPAPRPHR